MSGGSKAETIGKALGNGRLPPIVVMGVAGSGKSVVGMALAERLGARFVEGDRLHPARNVERMSRGIALTDADRVDWLEAIGAELAQSVAQGEPVVAACSALKRRYRDALRNHVPELLFVHLALDRETARRRVAQRRSHFMPASLIDSQFADLEEPQAGERGIVADAMLPVDQIVAGLIQALAMPGGERPHNVGVKT